MMCLIQSPVRLFLLLGLLTACDTPSAKTRADIPGARFLAFRCVVDSPTGPIGLPLDGCGCSEPITDEAGATHVRTFGRIECDCRTLSDGSEVSVPYVQVDPATCGDDGCQPTIDPETGDWRPGAKEGTRANPPTAMACTPRRNGRIRGYVGSPERGEVAVIDITPPGSGAETGRILDVDRTIPGVTAIFVDDLVSDVETHPDGDFVFTVNSSAGTLSVIPAEDKVREAFRIDLGMPLLEAVVWPSVGRPRPVLGEGALAFVSAPLDGAVLELDLDALGRGDENNVLRRRFELAPRDGHAEAPGHLAVTPLGDRLLVTHSRSPLISVFDRTGGPTRVVDLAPRSPCGDGFLVRLADEDTTCTDGFDNDGNGVADADDPACRGAARTEALDPACPKQSECNDGVDNDLDGLIDGEDSDCDPLGCVADTCPSVATWLDWEGSVPACADGRDNDDDGRIDRADPGCSSEGDNNEADPLERADADGLCDDGLDNDGDGLVDAEDPGCTDVDAALRYRFEAQPQCADGKDNDFDGRLDFGPAGDPDCYAASDDAEAPAAASVGPSALEVVGLPTADGLRQFAYVVDPTGNLLWIDLDDPALPVARVPLSRVTPLALAGRQIGDVASLLMVGNDTALRSIEISAPTPLVTLDGMPIFGQIDLDNTNEEIRKVVAFYVVQDGVAWQVTDGGPLDALVGTDLPANGLLHTALTQPVINFELPADVADRTPVEVLNPDYPTLDRGRADPLVYAAASVRTLLQREANVLSSAQGRTSRVVGGPRFFINNSGATPDPNRHPVLCQLPQPDPSAEGGVTTPEACIPVGYTAAGQLESRTDAEARTRFRVDLYEGIQVIENNPERVSGGTFALTFQGELPDTASRTGQFVSRESDERWTMVDYAVDFCARGIEVGDILLVDVFVPLDAAAGEEPECRALRAENRAGDPLSQREPLRYRVAEVAARKLVLERDTTSTFAAQLPRDDRSAVPLYYDAPPAPQQKCTAQFVAYRVRARQDDWLLTSNTAGYRHPWVNQDGQCVQSESRLAARRVGRVHLGETFESEWFRLHLDAYRPGIPVGRLPHMADARIEFDVAAGTAANRLTEFAIIPGVLRWLPNDDHAYVVDAAFETVVEAAGLNVYREAMNLVRQFR